MAARARILRLTAAAVICAGLLLAGCGEDDDDAAPGAGATVTTTTTAPAPLGGLDQALWPAPADAGPESTPRAVARSFVEDFVGVKDPALGEFQESEPRVGEVPVLRRGEDGRPTDRVVATVVLRRLDGERWFVTAALSDEIEVTQPEVLSEIASPVTVAGTGVGHEGSIVLRVHAAFDPDPLVRVPATAGAMEKAPFSERLGFERPSGAAGVIVAQAAQPVAGSDAFVAYPVRFAAGP